MSKSTAARWIAPGKAPDDATVRSPRAFKPERRESPAAPAFVFLPAARFTIARPIHQTPTPSAECWDNPVEIGWSFRPGFTGSNARDSRSGQTNVLSASNIRIYEPMWTEISKALLGPFKRHPNVVNIVLLGIIVALIGSFYVMSQRETVIFGERDKAIEARVSALQERFDTLQFSFARSEHGQRERNSSGPLRLGATLYSYFL